MPEQNLGGSSLRAFISLCRLRGEWWPRCRNPVATLTPCVQITTIANSLDGILLIPPSDGSSPSGSSSQMIVHTRRTALLCISIGNTMDFGFTEVRPKWFAWRKPHAAGLESPTDRRHCFQRQSSDIRTLSNDINPATPLRPVVSFRPKGEIFKIPHIRSG